MSKCDYFCNALWPYYLFTLLLRGKVPSKDDMIFRYVVGVLINVVRYAKNLTSRPNYSSIYRV